MRDLVSHGRFVPLEHRRHEPRDVVDGAAAAVLSLEGDVRSAREDVVHVQRRLVEHREPDLGRHVCVGAVQRRAQGRVLGHEVKDPQRQRAVAAREVIELDGREVRATGVQTGPPAGLRRSDGAQQGHVLRVAWRDSERQVARGHIHGVARHDAVGRVLAAGDAHEPRGAAPHHVLARDGRGVGRPLRHQRPQPDVHTGDVLDGQGLAEDRIGVPEQVVDVGAAGGGVVQTELPGSVRGADDPVRPPGQDEQDALLCGQDQREL